MKVALVGLLIACSVHVSHAVVGMMLPPFYVALIAGGGGGGTTNVTTVPIGTLCGTGTLVPGVTVGDGPGTCQPRDSCASPNVVIGNCAQFGFNGADLDCCQNVVAGSGTIVGPAPAIIVPESYLESYPARSKPLSPSRGPARNAVNIMVPQNVGQLKFTMLNFNLPVPGPTGQCDYKNSITFVAGQMPRGIFGPGSNNLCGQNTGKHFYLPVRGSETVQVLANLQGYGNAPPQSRNIANYEYEYRILVEFIGVNDVAAAPDGCLQYYQDSNDRISSFNFDGFSHMPCNQDYAICIRPNVDMAIGLTFKAETFALPATDVCVDGETIVCDGGVCCNQTPNSAYLAYTGYQKNQNKQSLRRYWCGDKLGPENLMSGSAYDVRVVSSCDWKCKYEPVGFNIDYKVDVGV